MTGLNEKLSVKSDVDAILHAVILIVELYVGLVSRGGIDKVFLIESAEVSEKFYLEINSHSPQLLNLNYEPNFRATFDTDECVI
ncbi:MAG: hypothetical protein ACI9SP_000090 [Arenicella sp.]